MLRAKFPPVFLRLFTFIYIHQVANVRWDGEYSDLFKMTNGVRQGAILSAIAYCFYCEELFSLLKSRRAGCWVLDNYYGIFGYSDDNWLLAPSLSSLQDMLSTCEEYAATHNLKFSTDPNPVKCKTKLMAFMSKPRELPSLLLCGTPLPWVDKIKHLGNHISNGKSRTDLDTQIKTSKYINKNNSIMQEFYFARPETLSMVNRIYNSHFTGSQLWDLGSREVEKLISTYNRSVKLMFGLPWATHRCLIQPIIGEPHISKVLISRFLSFISKVVHSKKSPLHTLLSIAKHDVRSTTGSNLRKIMLLSGKTSISDLKNVSVPYHDLPDDEAWKVEVIKELISSRHGDIQLPGWDKEEIEYIMNTLCTQ